MLYTRAALFAIVTYLIALQVLARFGVYIEHTIYSTNAGAVHVTYGWKDDGFDHETLSRLATMATVAGTVKIIGKEAAEGLARRFDKEEPGFYELYSTVPRYVTQTDLARLLAVYYGGGLYVDADVALRQPVPISPNGTWFVEKVVSVGSSGRVRRLSRPGSRTTRLRRRRGARW